MESSSGAGAAGTLYGHRSISVTKNREADSLVGHGIQLNARQIKLLAKRANGNKVVMKPSNQSGSVPLSVLSSQSSQSSSSNQHQQQQDSKKDHHLGKKQMHGISNRMHAPVGAASQDSEYWAEQPTHTGDTAPLTTWSESYSEADDVAASSVAGNSSSTTSRSHASSSGGNSATQFYGQQLNGKEKKLYDDTGATWDDESRSDHASSSATGGSAVVSSRSGVTGDPSRAPSQTSQRDMMTTTTNMREELLSIAKVETEPTMVPSTHSVASATTSVADSVLSGVTRKEESFVLHIESGESLEPLHSRSESIADVEPHRPPSVADLQANMRDQSVGHISTKPLHQEERNRKFAAKLAKKRQEQQELEQQQCQQFPNDPTSCQKAYKSRDSQSNVLLSRLLSTSKLMKSSSRDLTTSKASHSRDQVQEEDRHARKSNSKSWLSRMRLGNTSAKSGTSSRSSISQEDKAILRKVAARAQKSKVASTSPEKSGMMQSTSNRMKKILSPKPPLRSVSDDVPVPTAVSTSEQERDIEMSKERTESTMDERTHLESTPNEKEEDLDEATPPTLSRPVDISRVASRVMDDLIEHESDEEDDDEDELSIQKAKPIRSFADVVREDEIEIKISASAESGSITQEPAPTDPSGKSSATHVRSNVKGPLGRQDFLDAARAEFQRIEGATASISGTFAMEQLYGGKKEPEDYGDFVNALKADLSGSHAQLYTGFHALFEASADGRPPKPLSVYPGTLDLKSKDTATSMAAYLKKNSDSEWVAGSQMTSDRELQMSPKPGEIGFGQHLLHPSKKTTATFFKPEKVQPEPLKRRISPINVKTTKHPAIVRDDSMDTISAGPDGAEYEVTLNQHIRKSTGHIKALQPPPNTGGSIHEQKSLTSKATIADKPKILAPGAPQESIPWTSIKLRSISETSKDGSSVDNIPASWTKVKLRCVAPPANRGNTNVADPDDLENLKTGSFHRILLRKTRKKKSDETLDLELAPSSSTDITGTDKKPIEVASTVVSGTDSKPIDIVSTVVSGISRNPIDVVSDGGARSVNLELAASTSTVVSGTDRKPIDINAGGMLGQPIKLAGPTSDDDCVDQPLLRAQPVDLNEGSIMVALSKERNLDSKKELKLIVGRDGMMKVEAVPGESKVHVVWRLAPDDVKSALLDTSTFTVKLLVSSADMENRDLSFPTSEQCMKFVNALHEMTNSGASPSEAIVTPDSDDALYVEQLSEEEQKVLEEFRLRKSQPPATPEKGGPSQDFRKELMAITAGLKPNKPLSVVAMNDMAPPSPLSEVSGANHYSSLSSDDLKTTETYKKMLQMKIPKGGVLQKMAMNGVPLKIVEHGLGSDDVDVPPIDTNGAQSKNVLSVADEELVDKYRKMLKMMVPPDAVRHKMQKEGINPKIVAAVLGEAQADDYAANVCSPVQTELNLAEQAIAETYRKMLKMMIPKEAVEHKMKKEGIAQKIVLAVIGKIESASSAKTSKSTSLTAAEEAIASRYRKMLKMNVPKEQLRISMNQEGVSSKVMDAVLGKTTKKDQAPPYKRGNKQGFRWSPIADDESIAGSVWSKASKAKPMSETGAEKPEDIIDITKHIEMFQKQPERTEMKNRAAKTGSVSKEMAKLIDLNRANNVAITLKAFNDFSMSELAKVVEFLDPGSKIKGDRALFMKDLLPSCAEAKAIKSYKGGDELLVVAEKWFKEIIHIKRIEDKVEVMRTMETFKMDTIVLGKSFQLLTKVCNQVMDSDRLPDLLEMVREIGNKMNEDQGEAAAGFKLDFLPRLTQTKGSDKKTTALDLVVMIFMTRDNCEALNLSADFPDCQEASRVQLSDLISDVRNLEASINMSKKELEQLKLELVASRAGKPPKAVGALDPESRSDTALQNPPSALPLLKSDGVHSDIPDSDKEIDTNSKSPRASLLEALGEKSHETADFTLVASIRRLEKFLSEAEYVLLPRLEQDHKSAVTACRNLASFFCESGGEKAASNLLKILDQFATHIDQAVRKYDMRQEAEARRKAAEQRKAAVTFQPPPAPETPSKDAARTKMRVENKAPPNPENPSKLGSHQINDQETEKKSLVLMVNEMLKVAGDSEIKKFVEGHVSENPDSRLRQIYEAELARSQEQESSRQDILSAIKKRKNKNRESSAHQGLADLRAKLVDSPSKITPEPTGCRRRSSVANRWSSQARKETDDDDDQVSDMYVEEAGGKNSSIAERWSRKAPDSPGNNQFDSSDEAAYENDDPMEKNDSEILASSSHDTEDATHRQKRRQSYMNRWVAKTPVSEASTQDLDKESDIGAFEDVVNRTKQRYTSRWARNPLSSEEEV